MYRCLGTVISTILSLIGHPINYPYISLLGYQITFLNGMGNPILYTLTNRRFARFLRQLLSVKVSEWTKWHSTTTTNTAGNTNIDQNNNPRSNCSYTDQRQLPVSCNGEETEQICPRQLPTCCNGEEDVVIVPEAESESCSCIALHVYESESEV